ncbi:sugar ABC transporter permease [Oscillospiraceae bacterium 38-13]
MEERKNIRELISLEFGGSARQIVMLGVLALIWMGFSLLTGGTFVSSRNVSNLVLQSASTAIAATSIVWVLIAGHIDLSIGSFVGFTGAIAGICMVNLGLGVLPTILIVLLVGGLLGAFQGYWVAYRNVPAFIVTLAGMQIFRGGCMMVTKGVTISPMKDGFKAIGQAYIPSLFSAEGSLNDTALLAGVVLSVAYAGAQLRGVRSKKAYQLETAPTWFLVVKICVVSAAIMVVMAVLAVHLGIPVALILVGACTVAFTYISYRTKFGKYVHAIGGNRDAARLSGIDIKKITFIIFVVEGLMCALSSIFYTARLNSAAASAGQNMEMDVISAAIIGGTSTMGGEGSVPGAIIGALIMASINNGMSIMNLPSHAQYITKGIVLLLAVWMDVATRKKSR